ncbi:zinc finger protein 254-like [Diorhabda carinulata]|uniref:zinc finger protein 254-like n=1 Tax=Diorhabda carinulata TaxID=1163345 RepID=UPI0025A208EC|nr:zinc finger protein 254-like [Diorhabda carinulata]
MSAENIIDLGKCRICLQMDCEMDSFFNVYYEDLSLAKVFRNITSFDVEEDDRLPKNICISCRSTIINFNNLISIFQDTEVYLKNQLCKQELLEDVFTEEIILEETECDEAEEDHKDFNYETGNKIQQNFMQLNNVNGEYDYKCDYISELSEFCPKEDVNHSDPKDKSNNQISEVKNTLEKLSANGEFRYVNAVKYICECGDSFLYKMGFRHHKQYRHNVILDEDDFQKYSEAIQLTIPTGYSNPIEYVSPRQLLKRNKLVCRICSTKFETKEEVKVHEEIHKTHICDKCGAAFLKKSYLQDHQLMHSEERRYGCKVCGKAFKHRHTLSVHKKTHEDVRGFICEVCGDSFRARATLHTHTLLKHSDIKNFPCPSCNLRFNLKSSRDKHFVRKHTFNREKSFVCSKCGAAYLNKTTLTRHISDKHLGQAKYYHCTICENKMYVMKKGLRTHMMKKHGIFDV